MLIYHPLMNFYGIRGYQHKIYCNLNVSVFQIKILEVKKRSHFSHPNSGYALRWDDKVSYKSPDDHCYQTENVRERRQESSLDTSLV